MRLGMAGDMGGCEKKRASGEEVGSLFRGTHINDHINVSDILQ